MYVYVNISNLATIHRTWYTLTTSGASDIHQSNGIRHRRRLIGPTMKATTT